MKNSNYPRILIGRPIAILYVLARKITAEHLTVYFPSTVKFLGLVAVSR